MVPSSTALAAGATVLLSVAFGAGAVADKMRVVSFGCAACTTAGAAGVATGLAVSAAIFRGGTGWALDWAGGSGRGAGGGAGFSTRFGLRMTWCGRYEFVLVCCVTLGGGAGVGELQPARNRESAAMKPAPLWHTVAICHFARVPVTRLAGFDISVLSISRTRLCSFDTVTFRVALVGLFT